MKKGNTEASELKKKIKSVEKIKKSFDPETQLLSLIHEPKKYTQNEIVTDFFDINQSEKVTWLLVRIFPNRYKQIMLENVKGFKIITKQLNKKG